MMRGIHRLNLALFLNLVATVVVAQPQPEDRSTAELLVGEWQLLKIGDRPIIPGARTILTFAKDGKYHYEASGAVPVAKYSGTYRLTGKILETMREQGGKPETGRMQIVSVNTEKLLLLNVTPGDEQKVAECVRIKLK